MKDLMTKIDVAGLNTLPEPKILGPRHRPLPHHRFARVIDDTLADNGLEVVERDIEISHGGNRIFGTYRLEAPAHIRAAGEKLPGKVDPMLGFKNSVDQIFCGRVAMAGKVFNCSNGMWIMEQGFEVTRKNTLHAESGLRDLMRSMVDRYWQKFGTVLENQSVLANNHIHDREAHHLICEAQRAGITAHSHAGRVLDAWHDQPFDWGDKSLWRLHNCHTYVLDREVSNPYVRSARNLKLNELIGGYHNTSINREPNGGSQVYRGVRDLMSNN